MCPRGARKERDEDGTKEGDRVRKREKRVVEPLQQHNHGPRYNLRKEESHKSIL
tara:strand:+ start:81 stop:242 length:162 start_codon:yes stop_codon:yes gene_type:complete